MERTERKSHLLTASRLKAARTCQRLHYYQYALGYRAQLQALALKFGLLVHVGLETWWTLAQAGIDGEDRLARTIERLQQEEADPFDAAKAEALLTGYHYRWQEEPYKVLGVEAEFHTELRNPATGAASRTWELAGKVDALLLDARTGEHCLMEHKTSSEDITQGSDYWKRLRLDGQVSQYFEGAKSMGVIVDKCVYDVIGKPALKPLKATPEGARKYTKEGKLYAGQRLVDETPEEYRARIIEAITAEPDRYYQRGDVVRLESEMEDAMFDTWQTAQQMREAELAGRHPRNVDNCFKYNRPCPFWAVCSGEASLEDTSLYTQSDNVHPELEQENAQ